MSIYAFCDGCKDKVYEYNDSGKVVKHTCPARYNPFDEDISFDKGAREVVRTSKCTRHEKFMSMEKQKQECAAAKKRGE